jgi:histone deacetylase complex regulatory component SIN3
MFTNQKEPVNYEDTLRQLLGMQAYVLFTYDKATNNIIKQMLPLKNEYMAQESWRLFKKYENAPYQFKEEIYYQDFLKLIQAQSEPDFLIRLGKLFTQINFFKFMLI